jgi:hypothetical protein
LTLIMQVLKLSPETCDIMRAYCNKFLRYLVHFNYWEWLCGKKQNYSFNRTFCDPTIKPISQTLHHLHGLGNH